MTQRRALEALLAALAMGLGTWFGGWWAVPAVAALWQLLRRTTPPLVPAFGAALAWVVLLAILPWAPLDRLALRLSALFHLPPGGALLLPLAYAWLMAWSSARITRAITGHEPSATRMAKVTTAPPGSRTDSSSIP
ncbi:MAG TPA: hypothetical protein VMG41_08520 [Gemmatimonadales bacterium]|nr:hypothetical protein [Gemmatimonadales bacterium]